MNFTDLTAAFLAVALVIFTLVYNVRKRARGESSCAGCDRCGFRGACDKKIEDGRAEEL